jgi:CheY-like chemotaxis protein
LTAIIEELKTLAPSLGILYVEDNKGLRDNMAGLLGKFFPHIWIAADGREGHDLYLAHNPAIVLTDINMPEMKGLELAREIKVHNSDVRIIFLSAYDEKEYLHEAIEIGVFRYLTKPTKVPLLITALRDAALSIHDEQNKRIFENQLKDIFNYQNNLLIMLKDGDPVLVNHQFLNFFGLKSLDQFMKNNEEFNGLLLEHKGFLYSTSEAFWFDQAVANPGKLFHTKVLNHAKKACHLIMKLRTIPDKEGYTILSFDDITDLNLMMIFDNKAAQNDQKLQDNTAVLKLMNVIKENSSEVKLHNFYRGLTIVNNGVLIQSDNNEIVVKTTYSQLKAIKLDKNITITSELFPFSVLCKSANAIDFDTQTVAFTDMQFVQESADQRANIRLEPNEERHSVTLFQNDIKFFGKTRIVDISICSVKIEVDALPAGLAVGETAKIAIVFDTDKQPLNLSISGTVYRIDSFAKWFHIVLLFELTPANQDKLLGYLANRQIELIREFKAL